MKEAPQAGWGKLGWLGQQHGEGNAPPQPQMPF
jgi:hypothetical protein